ncbi:MAG TPA: amidohydrolase family protein [Acidimicrobiales bacterium]|nr:amidohydrolase family protein [Acidimicrobiales bacterium]
MDTKDMILVSVDDHVVEPPDLFEGHLPHRYMEQAPRNVTTDDGADVWVFEGVTLPNTALNSTAGRPPEDYSVEATSYSEMRAGCYVIDERVRDMSANGVLGSMCFPSFPQFCGQLFARASDKEVGLALVQAYNDWHIDEWCGTHPGRFIPLALPPLWDPALMAAEVHRVAAKGCHAITFSENPSRLGLPSLHSDHWDPFWSACCDEEVVVCLHLGSSSQMPVTASDAPIEVMIALSPVNLLHAATDLLWSPVLRRFPTIRFALSEGGIGWIPYFLERADWTHERHHRWTGQSFGGKLPSEVFREHVITCFIDDPVGLRNRHQIGVDSITWECDYPHPDTTWPTAPEALAPSLVGIPDDEVDKITHLNAMRHFHYDPFAHRPRERCTVGALRDEAADVDVALRNLVREGRRESPRNPVTTARDMGLGAKGEIGSRPTELAGRSLVGGDAGR